MANYFISLTGSDSNAGTELAPFRTLAKGVSMLSAPGDKLFIRGGTWNNERLYVGNKFGASGNPIVVQNYPGEQVVLEYNNIRIGSEWEGAVHIGGGSYVTIKGVDVGAQKGIKIRRANQRGGCIYTTGSNCGFDGVHAEYCFHSGFFIDYGTDCFIDYFYAYENAWDNNGAQSGNVIYTEPNGNLTWSGGASCGSVYNNNVIVRPRFRGGIAERNRGEGIGFFGLQNGGVIEDCIAFDNYSVNIYPDSVNGVTVQRNIVYQTANSYLRSWGSGQTPYLDGILTANEQAGKECKNMVIVNNFVRNGGLKVVAWAMNGASTTISNILCAHNTANQVTVGPGPQTNGTFIGNNYTGAIGQAGGNPQNKTYFLPTSPVSVARMASVLTDGLGNNRLDPTMTGAIDANASGAPVQTNLALNKPATASSTEGTAYPASAAFDGSTTTRWSSLQAADPQWLRVDLGARYSITGVTLLWEAAYASAFQIQVSDDGNTWSTIYGTTTGTGGTQNLTGLSGTGRYVRMYGTVRGTAYGYSLYEMQVFGTGIVTVTPPGDQTTTIGQAASLQIGAVDSGGGTLSYAASGLPAGIAINAGTGLISGTPTALGANTVTVTVTSTTGASAQVSFAWTIADVPWDAVPAPWQTSDIGPVGLAGTGEYRNGVFRLSGSGAQWWSVSDQGRLVSQPVSGDFDLTCRVLSLTNTSPYAKAGLFLRSSMDAGAAGVTINLTPNNGIESIRRAVTAENSVSDIATTTPWAWLRLVRSGGIVKRFYSQDGSPATVNVALGKTATASSTETAAFPASFAFDGTTSGSANRWSSAFSDPQWLQVDIGHSRTINRVKLYWEAAYATAYQIQVSTDGTNWTTVFTRTGGTGGIEDVAVTPTVGRYVRMYGTTRATAFGYSLHEMEVYGDPVWTELIAQQAMTLPDTVQAGLFACAHNNAELNTATFDNVSLTLMGTDSVGTASGSSTASAVVFNRWKVSSIGEATGSGEAVARAVTIVQSVGEAVGTSAVNGTVEDDSRFDFIGTAAGTSAVAGVVVNVVSSVGDARGSGIAAALTQTVIQSVGEAAGTSSCESSAYSDSVGEASGTCTAVAETETTTVAPVPVPVPIYTRTKDYIVQQGDTLRGIAMRLYRDVNRWSEIATINRLRPPHIIDSWKPLDRLSGTVVWGDTIQVAVAADATPANTGQLFGYDILLTRGDLVCTDGDIHTVAGVENLKQAVAHRIHTLLGELLYHAEYGCNVQLALGLQAEPVIRLMAAAWVHEAVRQDPRIASVDHIGATVDGDRLMITVRATTVGENTTIDLNLVTPK